MSAKKRKNPERAGGLGRSLGDLLADNDELTNLECKVLMRKSDGSQVKIYNKVDKKSDSVSQKGAKERREESYASRDPQKQHSTDFDKSRNNFHNLEINNTLTNETAIKNDRIMIGKTRAERQDESNGIYRHGKPHVIPEGESSERIRISAKEKAKSEPQRIVLNANELRNSNLSGGQGSISDALDKLDRYRPRAEDEFLDELREIADVSAQRSYEPDKNGRIVIGGGKAKVKKR